MICGREPCVSTLSSSGSFSWAGGVLGCPNFTLLQFSTRQFRSRPRPRFPPLRGAWGPARRQRPAGQVVFFLVGPP